MQPDQSGIKTWQWVVTAIVIIVLIIIGIIVFGNKSSEAPTPDNNNSAPTTQTGAVNRVVMSDQYPGNVVYLSSVQLAQPGYVAIHKDNGGQPGAIIGYAHFDKGINPGKITLTESTVEGGTYYAMLHADDGDGKFDAVKDAPLKDSRGNVIMQIFHASASVGAGMKG